MALEEAKFRLQESRFAADAARRKLEERQMEAAISKLESENNDLSIPWNKRPAYVSAWFQGFGAVLTLAGTIATAASIVAIIDLKHERYLADQSAADNKKKADDLATQIVGFRTESEKARNESDDARREASGAREAATTAAFQLSQTLQDLRQKRKEQETLEGTIATLKGNLDDAAVADVREVVEHGLISSLPFRKDLTEAEKSFLHQAAFNTKYDASRRFQLLLYLYEVDHDIALYNDALSMFSNEKSADVLVKMSKTLKDTLRPPAVATYLCDAFQERVRVLLLGNIDSLRVLAQQAEEEFDYVNTAACRNLVVDALSNGWWKPSQVSAIISMKDGPGSRTYESMAISGEPDQFRIARNERGAQSAWLSANEDLVRLVTDPEFLKTCNQEFFEKQHNFEWIELPEIQQLCRGH
ncbi:MAG: hypothetical protein JO099_03795 [Acidobacteriia bacterium]|nr:hypothetical protein [Terriglobia bacterium]